MTRFYKCVARKSAGEASIKFLISYYLVTGGPTKNLLLAGTAPKFFRRVLTWALSCSPFAQGDLVVYGLASIARLNR